MAIPIDTLGRILDNLFAAGLRLAGSGRDPAPWYDAEDADYISERLDYVIDEIRRAALRGQRTRRTALPDRPFLNGHFGS